MFLDREDAGARLGEALSYLRGEHPVVVGLPRGGVIVAAEVARALDAPLDVLVVRKLGLPRHPEFAMGAIGEGGFQVLNRSAIEANHITTDEVAMVERRETIELERRLRLYRGTHEAVPLAGRTVIVVDDGIATGSTARAAVAVVRSRDAFRVVLAAPVAPYAEMPALRAAVGDVVVLETPVYLHAIGQAYVHFDQTKDHDVRACLARAASSERGTIASSGPD